MAYSAEPSSSLSFTSSSHLSNGSVSHNICSSYGSDPGPNLEALSLSKLSSNFEQLLIETDCDYSDADIVVEGISVSVHRCILASRSKFFHELFKREKGSSEKEGKLKYNMSDLLPYGKRRLLNFIGKALVEDVIPILTVAFHCQLSQLVNQCIDRVARSDLDQISIDQELPNELSQKVKLLRRNPQRDVENDASIVDALSLKRITRIHKALDSDDVELVKLLLNESDITLDEANALHYAAAYCDPKVVSEVLGLGLANVNLRNSRGYTVLHIAAMRKEPSIIVSLLTKGACASDLTFDGQSAVSICRRLTRPKDYHAKTEQGKETNKDRICIDVLEREMWRNPLAGDACMSSHTMADDLHMKLLYLENRVAFARLFFPSEAKLAMDIAHAETTSEFAGLSASNSKGSNGNLREVDLNETPIVQSKRLFSRMEALMKTVEMGRRYFPHCSEVLDKFMEDDLPDLFYLEKGTNEEQRIKRTRFMELKDDVHKAFNMDKAEFSRSGISSSSSSSSLRDSVVHYKARKV
ncbi:Regulatory protein NPR3 isoform B [Glycine soja]|uniref:Regulatory protein NPR3 isoform B n=1 Tax=Glycine soja TaxID=3848 RepID=A0A445GSX2_GLYSO|nr:Regulatory protein NPR3 isoform B [Glycine soja]